MELFWLPRARKKRHDAIAYIAQDNPIAALSQLDEIDRQTDMLLEHSSMGQPGRVKNTRELVIGKTPFIVVWPGAVGAQQRQRDRVVTAEPAHVVSADQLDHEQLHRRPHAREAGVWQRQVAGIAEQTERRDIEKRVRRIAQHVAGFADRARTETRAGPVRDSTVPSHASDRERRGGRGCGRPQTGTLRQECG